MNEVTVNVRLRPDTPEPEPPPERIPRAARVLALAHKWRALIRSGAVKDQAELARLVGVSRARVTQVMGLLWLAPEIQEELLCRFPPERDAPPPRERDLHAVAALSRWADQMARRVALRRGCS
ncbi:MAG: hypothetical protein AB7U23_11295 [Dehalococcoidia bacterium]